MKKLLPYLSLILLLCSCQTTKQEKKQTESTKKEKSYEYQTKNIKNSQREYDVNISYPYFKDNETLNREIKSLILDPYQVFLEDAVLCFDEYPPELQLSLAYDATLQSMSENDKFISLLFQKYTFLGGAHGLTEMITVFYDKKKEKICGIEEASGLTLESVSKNCYNYFLTELSKEEFSELSWVQSGTEPDEDNFRAFTVSKDEKFMTVYFNPYSIGPYAIGIKEAVIKLKQ